MNTPTRIAAATALCLATAAQPALADHRYDDGGETTYEYARVLDVKPLIRTVQVEIPVRECYERPVEVRRERRRGGLGRVIAGGIIGGVIGSQFGDGNGREAMTVLGSVVGAASASDKNRHERESEHRVQKYCETTYEYEERDRVEGFRVTYEFDGKTYTTRTETDPGDEIRVRVDVRPLVD